MIRRQERLHLEADILFALGRKMRRLDWQPRLVVED